MKNLNFHIAAELSLISANVVAGSSRLTWPCLILSTRSDGRASMSTFKPTASAVFGLTPGPTPPNLVPSIAR